MVEGSPGHCGESDDKEAYLIVDCKIVKIQDIPITLMATFFVFNICYPIGCVNYYSFLEVVLMDYPIQKSSLTVKHLFGSLMQM